MEGVINATSYRNDDDLIDAMRYCYNDILTTQHYDNCFNNKLDIKQVIFNIPATIIIWKDNSKTIVKCCKDEEFDPEKGLAMAICKKVLGDGFKSCFKRWIPEEEEIITTTLYADDTIHTIIKNIEAMPILRDAFKKLEEDIKNNINIKL